MNASLWKKVLFSLVFVLVNFALFAENEEGKEEQDMNALQRWLRDKRLITVKELGGDLSLSAEVRTEMQVTSEKRNGAQQRGPHGATSKPMVAFDIEVNLMLDYRTDRTWTAVKLEFDNDAGTISGTTNKLQLEKAFFGGRAILMDTFTMDIELGRRRLDNIFDSKVEFGSFFDGLLFRLSKASEAVGDTFFNLGVFVVNDRFNRYGEVGEIGMLRIANTGLFTKYSFINWKKHNVKSPDDIKDLRYNYQVSQLMLGYMWTPQCWKRLIKFYLAGLYNSAAKKLPIANNRRANYGWYAGVAIGQVKKKGDWALEGNYQLVSPQLIPDFDTNGIGRGNAADIGFYTSILDPKKGDGVPNTRKTAVGGCNYRGWVVECLYAITDNLTMYNKFQMSQNQDKAVGPFIRYLQYELEFIFAF